MNRETIENALQTFVSEITESLAIDIIQKYTFHHTINIKYN